ncbi:MAG: hypothetical protein HOD11_10460 [Candidatus Marinimicrobia bacterium]|mgnify:CR=1 FL=1|nr:hypothetical protein [Candidatus Neomarinimicrobiota bacterium]MBT4361375.1 hypothetical protein [Candidatus Neomarinimicrobiota bacterium]MBT4994599.1 hypothetical protein [Candidatus Neomarinimicrobiota bacterium]MBT6758808.1 hypothetical protein [Candidatus Neomarinimicrobiota bacterium]MBT7200756.1 hypothetical protein [Candidatus Neomarinimicrobiota bacterium]
MKRLLELFVSISILLSFGCEKVEDEIIEITPLFDVDDTNLSDSMRTVLWEQANQISIRNIYEYESLFVDSILMYPVRATRST